MKKLMVVLLAPLLCFSFLFAPTILEARGGHGGGGFHGGGFHGGFHSGGFHGGSHSGVFHGGFRSAPVFRGRFFTPAPFFGFGAGFLAGYWLNGYYYTYPYYGACQRWVPTGSYHMETRQDPNTGAWIQVQARRIMGSCSLLLARVL